MQLLTVPVLPSTCPIANADPTPDEPRLHLIVARERDEAVSPPGDSARKRIAPTWLGDVPSLLFNRVADDCAPVFPVDPYIGVGDGGTKEEG